MYRLAWIVRYLTLSLGRSYFNRHFSRLATASSIQEKITGRALTPANMLFSRLRSVRPFSGRGPSLRHPFLIPEILLEVFEYMLRHDLASLMLVCRSWSNLCSNVLWRALDSLVPLFKLLSPMVKRFEGWVSILH